MESLSRRKLGILPVAALVALLGSCTAVEDNDTTNTLVYVTNMVGSAGDEVFSDVCIATGTTANPTCRVTNDVASVTVTALPKDQLRSSGQFNALYFTRYRVTYVRADGRGVPGVEVPYPFDNATDFSVTINASVTKSFTIVRQQGKLESPLINMQRAASGLVLTTLARVDFYGSDVSGRPITVTGYMNVTFGDFPDT